MNVKEIERTLVAIEAGTLVVPKLTAADTRARDLQQQLGTVEGELVAAEQALVAAKDTAEERLVTGQRVDERSLEDARRTIKTLADRLDLLRRASATVEREVAELRASQAAHITDALMPVFRAVIHEINTRADDLQQFDVLLDRIHRAAIAQIGTQSPLAQGYCGLVSAERLKTWRARVAGVPQMAPAVS